MVIIGIIARIGQFCDALMISDAINLNPNFAELFHMQYGCVAMYSDIRWPSHLFLSVVLFGARNPIGHRIANPVRILRDAFPRSKTVARFGPGPVPSCGRWIASSEMDRNDLSRTVVAATDSAGTGRDLRPQILENGRPGSALVEWWCILQTLRRSMTFVDVATRLQSLDLQAMNVTLSSPAPLVSLGTS